MFRKLIRTNKVQFGQRGEDIAVDYLQRSGYDIITRNYQGNGCEIDIVAAEGTDTIVFVEVKRRSDGLFGTPASAVNKAKQKRITKAAQSFILEHGLSDSFFRFDVITVTGSNESEPDLEHYEGAFVLPL